jgi:predicted PurR-regulated permease PerM
MTQNEPQFFSTNRLLGVIVILGLILLLQHAQAVFVPILLGILISYGLSRPVNWLSRIGIPSALGAAVLLLLFVATCALGVYTLSDDVVEIVEELPNAAQKLRAAMRRQGESGVIQKIEKAAEELEDTATEAVGTVDAPKGVVPVQIQERPLDLGGAVWWGSLGIAQLLSELGLLLFFVYFLLASGDLFRRKLVRIAGPTFAARKVTVETLNEISMQIERFVVVQFITSVIVAVLSAIVLNSVGLERPIVWGVAAGVFNSIPYFGPFIVGGGIFIVSFLQFGTLEMALFATMLVSMVTAVEGFGLTPWLMGRSLRMNGVAVFLGLLFWGWIWNVWGLLLAVPMLVITKAICMRIEGLKPIAELLDE